MKPAVGLVLSGGGARGAYEVGILSGLIEATAALANEARFEIVAGTSVGAINGSWIAANADERSYRIAGLEQLWSSLSLADHMRVDLRGLLGWLNPLRALHTPDDFALGDHFTRSILKPETFEALVRDSIDWDKLHHNIEHGLVRALMIAALHIGTGATTLFAELSNHVNQQQLIHPGRVTRFERIEADHVLASSAIPILLPARRIGSSYFVDGGLRFNTPISPAIRAGAQKLVIVSLHHETAAVLKANGDGVTELYPSPTFLAGKLLNTLLSDPITNDVEVLKRINELMRALNMTLTVEQREKLDQTMIERHGSAPRNIETLIFEPSQNIGLLAGAHLRNSKGGWNIGQMYERFLARAAHDAATWESDLASYLLFDGEWAQTLISLGRKDALARRGEIAAFFTSPQSTP